MITATEDGKKVNFRAKQKALFIYSLLWNYAYLEADKT